METNNLENKIQEKVLAKIKDEHLKPTSVWYFLAKDYSLWGLVLISILLAALSIAPIIFIIQNLELGYIKHISNNPILFVVNVLPYPWMLLCAFTTYFAAKAWANTAHGYKFDGKKVLTVSFFLSLLLGLILNFWNFGKALDDDFHANSFGFYKNMDQRRQENWFSPNQGRLIGNISITSTSSFTLVNQPNNYTEIVFFDDSVPGAELVNQGDDVRVIGFENDKTDFLACAIFPGNFTPSNHTNENATSSMSSSTRALLHDKIQKISELYPECKTVMAQGRANFQRHPADTN